MDEAGMADVPGPGDAADVAALVGALRLLRYWAGQPSLRRLRQLGGKTVDRNGTAIDSLPEATTSYLLRGDRPLRAEFLRAFVIACMRARRRSPEEIRDQVERWHSAWLRLSTPPRVAVCVPTTARSGSQTHAAHGVAGSPGPEVAERLIARQLPADLARFVGRKVELDQLEALAAEEDPSNVGPVLATIDGIGGVGKTALAVRAAHRLAHRFPDGQLFVDLRGFTDQQTPLEAVEALQRLLTALGVDGTRIPPDLEGRASLWRSVVADRRVLIVLDNAATAAQVVPLLPGTAGPLVITTSRRRLAGLPYASQQISLDMLPHADAVTLLGGVAGSGRTASAAAEVLDEVVELCWRLPLAVDIAATLLRSHPAWTAADLASRLGEGHERLAELADGPRSVTVVVQVSYQHLSPDQQRFYRLLGLHPGPDIEAYAAAALAGITPVRARRLLDQLLDERLLLEPAAGRYAFHDLVRSHAAITAASVERSASRQAAIGRLLGYYAQTAKNATASTYPHESNHLSAIPAITAATPDLHDPIRAECWLDSEMPNLLAIARHAAEHRSAYTIHLSIVLHRHLAARGHYRAAEALHLRALAATRDRGNQQGQLAALNSLGNVQRLQSRYRHAGTSHQQALDLSQITGDHAAELEAQLGLGHVDRLQGRYPQALDHYHRALELAQTAGNQIGELGALTGLGNVHLLRCHYQQAGTCFQQALEIALATGDRQREVFALGGLATVHNLRGHHQQAASCHQQALEIARAIGNHSGQLYALNSLGHISWVQGQHQPAANHFQQALDIARTTGHRQGELYALYGLGRANHGKRQHRPATDCYQQALELAKQINDRNMQVQTLIGLGRLHHATSHWESALNHHREALALATDLDQPDDQARAHDGLAHTHHALDNRDEARRHWQHALAILNRLGTEHTDDPQTTAPAIRAKLDDLDRQGSAS
jgi:tetratricopeptide (TPR) repeat protein